jgi:hypothetical protein
MTVLSSTFSKYNILDSPNSINENILDFSNINTGVSPDIVAMFRRVTSKFGLLDFTQSGRPKVDITIPPSIAAKLSTEEKRRYIEREKERLKSLETPENGFQKYARYYIAYFNSLAYNNNLLLCNARFFYSILWPLHSDDNEQIKVEDPDTGKEIQIGRVRVKNAIRAFSIGKVVLLEKNLAEKFFNEVGATVVYGTINDPSKFFYPDDSLMDKKIPNSDDPNQLKQLAYSIAKLFGSTIVSPNPAAIKEIGLESLSPYIKDIKSDLKPYLDMIARMVIRDLDKLYMVTPNDINIPGLTDLEDDTNRAVYRAIVNFVQSKVIELYYPPLKPAVYIKEFETPDKIIHQMDILKYHGFNNLDVRDEETIAKDKADEFIKRFKRKVNAAALTDRAMKFDKYTRYLQVIKKHGIDSLSDEDKLEFIELQKMDYESLYKKYIRYREYKDRLWDAVPLTQSEYDRLIYLDGLYKSDTINLANIKGFEADNPQLKINREEFQKLLKEYKASVAAGGSPFDKDKLDKLNLLSKLVGDETVYIQPRYQFLINLHQSNQVTKGNVDMSLAQYNLLLKLDQQYNNGLGNYPPPIILPPR